MNFERVIEQAANAVKASARKARRPAITDARRMRRRRAGLVTVAISFVTTIVVIGGVVTWIGAPLGTGTAAGPDGNEPAVGVTTTTTLAENSRQTNDDWSIAYSSAWYRADSGLVPFSGNDSLTLATFPLRPGGATCGFLPGNALRDIGSSDALLSMFFGGSFAGDTTAWPVEGFNDATFPQPLSTTDARECSIQPGVQLFLDQWQLGNNELVVLVAFGPDTSQEVRMRTWNVLSSLRAGNVPVSTDEPICVVTRPLESGFLPPAPYERGPADDTVALYGTADLWTRLPLDGRHVPTKGAWWSGDYGGGAVEEEPAITVTWRRIDGTASPIGSSGPGGNAYTADDGWFMLQGIGPEPSGCWQVTATYRNAELSYVTNVP